MKLQISELKTERQWRPATGFDQPRFEKLLALFSKSYFNFFGQTVVDRHAVLEITSHLAS